VGSDLSHHCKDDTHFNVKRGANQNLCSMDLNLTWKKKPERYDERNHIHHMLLVGFGFWVYSVNAGSSVLGEQW